MKVKKLFGAIVVFCIAAFVSCSSSRQANSSPSAGQWRKGVKGQWVLNAIEKKSFPSGASVKKIFEEAPIECFIGSTWNLAGSGKGSISFNASGELCAPGATRAIHWSIHKPEDGGEPQFQFKKLFPGERAKDVTSGYRLELAYADESTLTMNMPVKAGGNQESYLEFRFVKR